MQRYAQTDELRHYGVPGMKWGKRKARPTSDLRRRYDDARAAKKAANKAYNKAFDKAYDNAIAGYSPFKKHREANTKRWDDAWEKGQVSRKADEAYKSVKKERKQAIKDTYKDINKNSSIGEKLLFSEGTRKAAAKYVVDNNMSVSDAKKKANQEAIRNTAITLAAIGAYSVAATKMMK